MEIPLTLKKSADGRVSYGIPLWYRIATAAMLLLIAGGIFIAGGPPSLIAWIILALLLLGLAYEERWVVDPQARLVRYFSGFWPIARAMNIGFDEIDEFCLSAFARGTVPGSAEEEKDKEKAFAMMKGKDTNDMSKSAFQKWTGHKPYINLLLKTKSGETYLVNTLPARRGGRLNKAAQMLAASSESRYTEPNV
ncbi:MAG TPA: hypothetical protein VN445_08575 [Rectinemataceae bacterium]|nr:hypothetical protein [Rectinemataceae bacterium]